MSKISESRIGFAMTGSFCTFLPALAALEQLAATGARITPILSFNAGATDTRFIKSGELRLRLKAITGRDIIDTIAGAEPVGPKKLFDLLIIAPCTGNTAAKLALGVTDTPVTMAAKAHLRNERPLLLAIATNDALSANAKNIGVLMNTRNIYFVPMGQDDFAGKRSSVVADMPRLTEAAVSAMAGTQLQPLLMR